MMVTSEDENGSATWSQERVHEEKKREICTQTCSNSEEAGILDSETP